MLLTTRYSNLYFDETEEDKLDFDEIGCYCGVCIATKNIFSFFVKKLKNQKFNLE